MEPIVIQNTLAEECLTLLRDRSTRPAQFRSAGRRIGLVLAVEAGKLLETLEVQVDTPLESTRCRTVASPVVLVPVLRAGLGLTDAFLELFPEAEVGHVGLERNEATAQADSYYCKLPQLAGKQVFLLDPMLATGGSLAQAVDLLKARGASSVVAACIIAAPEGIAHVRSRHPDLQLVLGAIDRELDSHHYIRPGLGDYGDRLMGTH